MPLYVECVLCVCRPLCVLDERTVPPRGFRNKIRAASHKSTGQSIASHRMSGMSRSVAIVLAPCSACTVPCRLLPSALAPGLAALAAAVPAAVAAAGLAAALVAAGLAASSGTPLAPPPRVCGEVYLALPSTGAPDVMPPSVPPA